MKIDPTDLTEDQLKSYTDRIEPLLTILGIDAAIGTRIDHLADLISRSEAKIRELQFSVDEIRRNITSPRAEAQEATQVGGTNYHCHGWTWNEWREGIDRPLEQLETMQAAT
ncbi:unnamed protein product [Zymoseptoria tritici ST99CH_1A5]|uniref:Uncharacterized protein n=3 Tax=Zymoseptoria tritici TaxID=1047171 RepID=A0A1X7S9M5_ZYMT9|nr:unnamed protein product [Zymoseptoria tritici ST99CH_3D7]SMR61112.1 unnamed protein product [Zymoseptoria tritici ST99CH_1E4]SMR64262.1 unnamed protein product [Zymoseptoria tritici ST99CH_3D1]SMY29607.1 unnamed protein product [Zymoseptoria tritici ST99CH_1A5]